MGHSSSPSLAVRTTLGVGGPAARIMNAASVTEVREAARSAAGSGLPLFVMGGGSNLLVSDAGFPGVVLSLSGDRLELRPDGTVIADAGVAWERLVDAAVAADLAGVECLTGIPGTVGAAPIQNIGAYGQEVADTLVRVRAWDRVDEVEVTLEAEDCGFAYRDSRFKHSPERFVVLAVELRLKPGGVPCTRYDEVRRAVPGSKDAPPTLLQVRAAVRTLRRGKGMLLESTTMPAPNTRSAGSFFTNPIVCAAAAAELPPAAPKHPAGSGLVKVAAAWLIEHAGIQRGFALGRAAISTQHTLALVNLGGATSDEVVRLAAWVRRAVRRRFGLTLSPEPVFLGFDAPPADVLDAAERTLPDVA